MLYRGVIMKKISLLITAALCSLILSTFASTPLALAVDISENKSTATAPSKTSFQGSSHKGDILAGLGGGILLNPPVRFDLNMIGEYYLLDEVSLGLQMDIGLRGPTTFNFLGFGRYHFDLASLFDSHQLTRWDLFAGGGLGGAVNTNGNGNMDIMIPEFGIRYELTEWLTLGPDFSFHILTNFDNATWDFRILFVQAEYRF